MQIYTRRPHATGKCEIWRRRSMFGLSMSRRIAKEAYKHCSSRRSRIPLAFIRNNSIGNTAKLVREEGNKWSSKIPPFFCVGEERLSVALWNIFGSPAASEGGEENNFFLKKNTRKKKKWKGMDSAISGLRPHTRLCLPGWMHRGNCGRSSEIATSFPFRLTVQSMYKIRNNIRNTSVGRSKLRWAICPTLDGEKSNAMDRTRLRDSRGCVRRRGAWRVTLLVQCE